MWNFFFTRHKSSFIFFKNFVLCVQEIINRRGSRNFSKGDWGGKFWKIHVSTHVLIKTRQTCNSFFLLPFQEDCLFNFFFVLLLSFIFEIRKGGGCDPRNPPPLDPPMIKIGQAVSYWFVNSVLTNDI